MKTNWHNYLNELPTNPEGEVRPARWVTLEEAHFLYFVLRQHKPETLFESGTANGFSTAWAALAMEENQVGRIYTYDPADRPKVWDYMEEFQAKTRITYINGPFLECAPSNVNKGTQAKTAFFVDGDHSRASFQKDIERVNEIASPGDVIILHDVLGYGWISKYFDRTAGDESMLVRSAHGIGFYLVTAG